MSFITATQSITSFFPDICSNMCRVTFRSFKTRHSLFFTVFQLQTDQQSIQNIWYIHYNLHLKSLLVSSMRNYGILQFDNVPVQKLKTSTQQKDPFTTTCLTFILQEFFQLWASSDKTVSQDIGLWFHLCSVLGQHTSSAYKCIKETASLNWPNCSLNLGKCGSHELWHVQEFDISWNRSQYNLKNDIYKKIS